MTEPEAKTKWCPFARYAVFSKYGNSSAANRLGDDNGYRENAEQCRCIGSSCMAWRWTTQDTGDPFHVVVSEGYCGLGSQNGLV